MKKTPLLKYQFPRHDSKISRWWPHMTLPVSWFCFERFEKNRTDCPVIRRKDYVQLSRWGISIRMKCCTPSDAVWTSFLIFLFIPVRVGYCGLRRCMQKVVKHELNYSQPRFKSCEVIVSGSLLRSSKVELLTTSRNLSISWATLWKFDCSSFSIKELIGRFIFTKLYFLFFWLRRGNGTRLSLSCIDCCGGLVRHHRYSSTLHCISFLWVNWKSLPE